MFPATMRPSPLLRAAVLAAGLLLVPPAVWSKSAKEVFRQAAPSVVVVLALGRNGATTGQGSGVVVGRTEVVTNCHVVEDAAGIAVRQASDHTGETTWRMEASVLARNDERDLCLLHVDQLSDPPAPAAARLGSAKTLSVGEEVYAIGAPRGLELSLSRGIVSQLRGVLGKRRGPLIQTDAAISPGSSGGGLFNGDGELVGITTFKRRGENLNFALPADWVRELREQGRSALEAAKLQAECEENPNFDCLVVLAQRDANSIHHHLRDGALFHVVHALMNIANVQAKLENRHTAIGTLADAYRTAQRIDDVEHRARALKDIADAQLKAGNVTDALETAQKIDDAGGRARALRRIADAQLKAGNVTDALETAQEINKEAWWLRAWALRDIAYAQTKAGNRQAARQTLADALKTTQEIGNAKDRTQALRSIADAQAKAGNRQAARQTLVDALKTAQEIDEAGSRAQALRDIADAQATIADALAKAGNVAEALKTAQEIEHAQAHAWTLRHIAVALAKAGNMTETLKIAQKIVHVENRIVALSDIAATLAETGKVTEALKIAQEMDQPGAHAYVSRYIAGGLAKAGNVTEALKITQTIPGGLTLRGEALREIATALEKIEDRQTARQLLTDAVKAAQEIIFESDRAETLSDIADAQAKTGDLQAAKQTRQSAIQMWMDALKTDQEMGNASTRTWSLTRIADAQAKAGDATGALETAQKIENARDRAKVLQDIADAQAKAGDATDALETAQKIENAGDRAETLSDIADTQVKAGDLQAARQTWEDAIKAAQKIADTQFRTRAQVLRQITNTQAKAGDVGNALKTTQKIEDVLVRAWALGNIATAQAKAGDRLATRRTFAAIFSAAQEYAHDIDASYFHLWVSTEILSTLAEAGSVQDVKDAIKAFKNAAKARWRTPSEAALRLDRSDRVLVQRGLASLGKDVGAADGVFGQRTRAAVRSWQVDAGFKATGHLTREQADRLIAAGRAAATTEAQRLKEFCAEVPQSELCRDP